MQSEEQATTVNMEKRSKEEEQRVGKKRESSGQMVYIGYLWGEREAEQDEQRGKTDGQDGWAGGSWGSDKLLRVPVSPPPHLQATLACKPESFSRDCRFLFGPKALCRLVWNHETFWSSPATGAQNSSVVCMMRGESNVLLAVFTMRVGQTMGGGGGRQRQECLGGKWRCIPARRGLCGHRIEYTKFFMIFAEVGRTENEMG